MDERVVVSRRPTGQSWVRRVVGFTAVCGAMLALFVFLRGVDAGGAHTALVDSSPAADSRVADPPTQVQLRFSEDIHPDFAIIQVNGPNGQLPGDDRAAVAGPTARIALGPADGPGTYTVAYRVVSAHGHDVVGQFGFEILPPAAQSTPAAVHSTPADSLAPVDPEPARSPLLLILGLALVVVPLTLLLVAGRRILG